jgi:hypothetical protein
MKCKALTSGVVVLVALLVGCNRPHPPVEPPVEVLVIDKDRIDDVWDETLDVLREHYFIPDRQDRRAGLIVSYPTLSKQWFEFWRDDAQGCYEVAESSLQSIRRTVEVRFVPVKNGYEVRFNVIVQRKNQPERQITSASATIMAFRDKSPLTTGDRVTRGTGVIWVTVGEDTKLANYLLHRLERRVPTVE